MSPKVSILVPIYNVERYLERCLNSLISQSMEKIEIICVNDGSTDKSLEILEKYQRLDSRIVVITQVNKGLPATRNTAIEVATGEYLGFVDSDDYVNENMFEKLVNIAEKDKADIVICGANIVGKNSGNEEWLKSSLAPRNKKYSKFNTKMLFNRVDTTPFLWRTLIKRELITLNKLKLDEDIILGEDKLFQCKVYPFAKRISIIEDKLYNYVIGREDSLTICLGQKNLYDKLISHCKLIDRIADNLLKNSNLNSLSTYKRFLNWSIPFIYQDFLHVEPEKKAFIKYIIPNVLRIFDHFDIKKLLKTTTTNMLMQVKQLSKYDDIEAICIELFGCDKLYMNNIYLTFDLIEVILIESTKNKHFEIFIDSLKKLSSIENIIVKKAKHTCFFEGCKLKSNNELNELIFRLARIVNIVSDSEAFDEEKIDKYNPTPILYKLIKLKQENLNKN